jgi:hypothetical protein
MPPTVNVGGTAVQVIDQRPEWEKKPFTGVVCMYHLDKAHPGAWEQLAKETNEVVAALPQKPERVEVVVTSYRLVRSGDTAPRYRDWSAGPVANPSIRTQAQVRANGEERERRLAEVHGTAPNTPAPAARQQDGQAPTGTAGPTDERPGNSVELAFTSKDDPRRKLRTHPLGASCCLHATVKLTYPGGQVQTVNVETIARGTNNTGTVYHGEAIDDAAKGAVFQFGRQFRSGVGLNPDV